MGDRPETNCTEVSAFNMIPMNEQTCNTKNEVIGAVEKAGDARDTECRMIPDAI